MAGGGSVSKDGAVVERRRQGGEKSGVQGRNLPGGRSGRGRRKEVTEGWAGVKRRWQWVGGRGSKDATGGQRMRKCVTADRRFAALTFLCFFSSFFVLLSFLFIFLRMVLLTLNLMNTTKL